MKDRAGREQGVQTHAAHGRSIMHQSRTKIAKSALMVAPLLALGLGLPASRAPAADSPPAASAERNGQHDFDFLFGRWKMHTWTPPYAKPLLRFWIPGRDCSHTFGLGERRLAAGPDGIRWLTPNQICGLLMSIEPGRIRQPRSDLVCHHLEDACAISGVCVLRGKTVRCARTRPVNYAAAWAGTVP
jgi:hypothetical protein